MPRRSIRNHLADLEAAGLIARGVATRRARGGPGDAGYSLTPIGAAASKLLQSMVRVIGEYLHPPTVARLLRWYQFDAGCTLHAMRTGRARRDAKHIIPMMPIASGTATSYAAALRAAGLLLAPEPGSSRYHLTPAGKDWLDQAAHLKALVAAPAATAPAAFGPDFPFGVPA